MRWPASFSFGLLLSAGAVAASRRGDSQDLPTVYLYDPQSTPLADTDSSVVDPYAATLIIAQRLGLSSYYTLGDISDLDLQHLNRYTTLPSDSTSRSGASTPCDHALVLIDHAESLDDAATLPSLNSFQLSTSPRLQDGAQLLGTFSEQARALHGSASKVTEIGLDIVLFSKNIGGQKYTWSAAGSERRRIDMQYRDVKGASRQDGQELVRKFIEAAIKGGTALTLVVNPKPTRGSGSGSNVYGDVFSSRDGTLMRREEIPFIEPIDVSESAPSSTGREKVFAGNATSFPLTPRCYESADDCKSETNSCSGHGKCVLTRKGPPSGDDQDPNECYQCRCEPNVVKNSDGTTKTTYYGGSACQKQDISAPFWILTLTTGSLIALVGFGVSMLYAMGSAELPSVIGAGVSGPRAK